MMFVKTLLLLTLITACSVLVNAQAPSQIAPAKVGIINSESFANPTGGITRLVNALKAIQTEFKPRRDEIARLVAQFDTLQQVPPNTPAAQLAARRDQAQTLQIDIQRKQEDARVAYAKRLSALTDPIRATVYTALEVYTKQHGLDVLIDISKFPDGVLLANRNLDLTPGFIREFNSKNP